jgi:hypothetical protein
MIKDAIANFVAERQKPIICSLLPATEFVAVASSSHTQIFLWWIGTRK